MLDLEDEWVWDFWLCQDDERLFHAFFLKAPRSLGDPELRHRHASAGHAVSSDLTTWTRVDDALDPQPAPAYDDLAIWTGSVVRAPSGDWRMFTTGLSRADDGLVQRIGASVSDDLVSWRRDPNPLLEASPEWYATLETGESVTHWRDPWVFHAGGQWHLLATAKSVRTGGAVVAHAVSDDLEDWRITAPLTAPSRRFGQAEVISAQLVQERWVLVFSCLSDQMPGSAPGGGGVWTLPVPSPESWGEDPVFDLDSAVRLTNERLYVGKLVEVLGAGRRFLAFRNRDSRGRFVGGVIDPLPVRWRSDGSGLVLVDPPRPWRPAAQPARRAVRSIASANAAKRS